MWRDGGFAFLRGALHNVLMHIFEDTLQVIYAKSLLGANFVDVLDDDFSSAAGLDTRQRAILWKSCERGQRAAVTQTW